MKTEANKFNVLIRLLIQYSVSTSHSKDYFEKLKNEAQYANLAGWPPNRMK